MTSMDRNTERRGLKEKIEMESKKYRVGPSGEFWASYMWWPQQ